MLIEAIKTILAADATLEAQVSTRIYAENAAAKAANPCIVYSIESQDPEYTKDGAATVIYSFLEVDIFCENTPKTGFTIAGLVKDVLDQYTGTENGVTIDDIQWEGTEGNGYNPDRNEYQISMGFRIRQK